MCFHLIFQFKFTTRKRTCLRLKSIFIQIKELLEKLSDKKENWSFKERSKMCHTFLFINTGEIYWRKQECTLCSGTLTNCPLFKFYREMKYKTLIDEKFSWGNDWDWWKFSFNWINFSFNLLILLDLICIYLTFLFHFLFNQ